jgi:hypothetical protein
VLGSGGEYLEISTFLSAQKIAQVQVRDGTGFLTRMEPKLYSLGRPGSFSTKYDVYLYPVMSLPLFQAIPDKQNAA